MMQDAWNAGQPVVRVPVVRVVDDDASVCAALDGLFRSVGLSVALYGSVAELLRGGHVDVPGCLVLDVHLPGVSGLDFQSQLTARDDALPVILMTGHGDIPMTVRAMKAGAVDFLAKPFRDQDMLDAVTAAIARDQARRAGSAALAGLRVRYASLTAREREVMALVVAGLMNKQVAHRIGLSEITVKIHRGSVMRKMAAASLAELVRQAGTLGLRPTERTEPQT
jgi:FixJ family two-component response regulator